MSAALAQTRAMTLRHLRELWRQPWFVAIMLVQPLIWLLLFGSLFEHVVEIPGFGGGDDIDFLTPGLVVMTALFSAGWSGMGVIEDLNRGVMDRFLVSPVSRASLIAGRLGSLALTVAIQSLIVVAIGMAVGARFPGGIVGIAVLAGCAVLLACSVGSLSIGLALVARQEETLIASVQLVVLPATFLSAGLMAQSLAPGWVQDVARYNPVNWAVQAGRGTLGDNVDWGLVGSRALLLVALAVLCGWVATRAFHAYQRSV